MKTAKDVHLPIRYTDADGHEIKVVVSLAAAKVLCADDEERQALQERRHHTQEGYVEAISEASAFYALPQTEDIALTRLNFRQACDCLTDAQRRRLIAHYVHGYTFREIALAEDVGHKAIVFSVQQAIRMIKNIF